MGALADLCNHMKRAKDVLADDSIDFGRSADMARAVAHPSHGGSWEAKFQQHLYLRTGHFKRSQVLKGRQRLPEWLSCLPTGQFKGWPI